jgi:hypothetical protein
MLGIILTHGTFIYANKAVQNECKPDKERLADYRCDSQGYYFDRGGRRMFETSYDSYKKGTFNLRRGHLWSCHSCCKERRLHKSRCCQAAETGAGDKVVHAHYSGQSGLAHWPTSTGPDNGRAGTKGYPYVETPVWLRDTTDAGGYSTPTSWQGFQ